MDYYEVESLVSSKVGEAESNARYHAEDVARQAYYDGQRYTDEGLSAARNDMHASFEDLRQGLAELEDRVLKLEHPEQFKGE